MRPEDTMLASGESAQSDKPDTAARMAEGVFYNYLHGAATVRVLQSGSIQIDVGGQVVVLTPEKIHALAWEGRTIRPELTERTINAGGSGVRGPGDEVKDSLLAPAAPAEGPTPRVDDVVTGLNSMGDWTKVIDLARQLERELADEIRTVRAIQSELDRVNAAALSARGRSEEAVAAEALSLFLENRDKHGHSEDKAIYETLRDFAEAADFAAPVSTTTRRCPAGGCHYPDRCALAGVCAATDTRVASEKDSGVPKNSQSISADTTVVQPKEK